MKLLFKIDNIFIFVRMSFCVRSSYFRYKLFVAMFAATLVIFIHGIQFVNIYNKFKLSQKTEVEPSQHMKAPGICQPKQQVVFVKTHKTGGSTVQNILFRHCLRNNLSIAFPATKTWMFRYNQSFSANEVEGYRSTGTTNQYNTFDVFLFHSVWNHSEVRKVVPHGPVVTLIRDPVDMFESGYVYFGIKPKNINEFVISKLNATNNTQRRPNRKWPKLNQLQFDFGVLEEKQEDSIQFVKNKIVELDKQFDLGENKDFVYSKNMGKHFENDNNLVMISEQMVPGLILLKEMMCWNLQDVTFLNQNERKPSLKRGMSKFSRAKLKEWLWAEYMIYDYFVQKFETLKKQYINRVGRDVFIEKIRQLQLANKQVYSQCVVEQTDNEHGLKGQYKMALDRVLGYKVNENKTWCRYFAISEPYFTSILRNKQFQNDIKAEK